MMQFNPLSFLLAIVGGLIIAGLLGWVRRSRLIVLVPNTFSYSQITMKGGQLVEITVFNRGFKTEELIDVTLNPKMTYEILGSNNQDVSVEQNRLKIVRIAPSDEVTALLIVENGDFKPDDIIQTTSKESKGFRVAELADVTPTGPQRAFLLGVLVGLPALMYAGYLGLDQAFNKPSKAVAGAADAAVVEKDKQPIKAGSWNIPDFYESKTSNLFKDAVSGKMSVTVGTPTSKGDITTIPFKLTNAGTQTIQATINVNTNGSGNRIPSYELMKRDIYVRAGGTEERSLKVVIPAKLANPDDRTVYMEVFLQSMTGDTLKLKQAYIVGG